ncbi:MAG TPA: AAA family ATPase [Nannocystis sp.]
MLTRVEIDGFKSLQDFAIDLEPFTVLIGPNSAGKSNVLEALALLSRLAYMPIAEAFKHGRGRSSDQFTRVGAEGAAVTKIRFAVEFLVYGEYRRGAAAATPAEQSRFRYELTIERAVLPSGAEQLVASEERLTAIRREDDRWIESHPEFASLASHAHGGTIYVTAERRSPSGERRIVGPGHVPEKIRIPPSHTILSQLDSLPLMNLREKLELLRILRLDPTRLGEPSDPLDSGELAEDGSNLPTVLAGLPPAVVGAIRADLVALVPGVASFEVVRDGDELFIDFELAGGERMPARLVSDGTLRILLLLTALRLEPRPAFIGIEEPENGIYPGRLRMLLEHLRAETTRRYDDPEALAQLAAELESSGARGISRDLLPTQIVVTSHSPVIVAALRKQPQHLRFIDVVRRDGHRPVLKRILQDGGARLGSRSIYEFFGARVRLANLRALSSFRAFEAELTTAVREFVAAQGYRSG